MIELNDKALKRRAKELHGAASSLDEESSRALLLFYAAECGLKAIYMQKFMLRTTASSNAAAKSPASFKHNLDDLIKALKLPPRALRHSPGKLSLRPPATDDIRVGDLNQVWRYGATLATPNTAVQWLETVVAYALKELR